LTSVFLSLAVIAIPLAIGIAIFRQGLLDVDRILNRTLTYGAITIILAVAFAVVSLTANAVLQAITGQPSQLVVAASLVPIALLFLPVRTRVLRIADRFVADRTVMTLMFVDLVGSTERAYAIGDRAWRDLLQRFRSTVRRSLKRYGGKEVDTAGDGFFVTFEGPGRAVRCAREVIEMVRPLDLAVRVGVHIGEVQVDGSHVTGVAVHVASRVMSLAGPGRCSSPGRSATSSPAQTSS
jgi:class 3 adenylate cyclase